MTFTQFTQSITVRSNGVALPPDVASSITDVTVTQVFNAMDSFELTLVNPYSQLPWTAAASEALLREGDEIAIGLGYVQDAPTLLEGIITGVRAQFPASGAPTLTISGYNHLYALQAHAGTVEFVNTTDSQIVEQIAARAGLTALVSPTPVIYPSVWQTGQTDLAFVAERATRLDYELAAEGRTLIFRPHDAGQPESYSLTWGQPKVDIGLFGGTAPLRRLDVELNLAEQVSSVIVSGTDPASGALIVGRAGAAQEPDVPALPIFNRPVVSLDEAQTLAQAIFSQRSRRLITASGATLGLPYLRAGQIIVLEGIGRFSGRYYLTRTTHSFGDDGYETTFASEKEPIP